MDCGNKKFCIRNPLNCDPEKEHACFFLSFTRDDQSVMVEMSGPSKGYLSFAFSDDRWMVCISHLHEGNERRLTGVRANQWQFSGLFQSRIIVLKRGMGRAGQEKLRTDSK